MMESGVVFDIRKFSLHDGPGIRTAVFLKGCPLSCPWCHNPEGRDPRPSLLRRPERCVGCLSCVAACPLALDPRAAAGTGACAACPGFGVCARSCPAEAIQQVGRRMDVAEVMAIVRQDRPFYEESGGGATFTGGEPLAQASFLLALLEACAAEGIHTAIETSGYAGTETLLEAARLADLLLFDLKTADPVRGSAFTGVDYRICLYNLEAAAGARAADPAYANVVVRMPIIPGQNDGAREIEAAADFVARLAAGPDKGARCRRDPDDRLQLAASDHLSVALLPYHDAAKGKCHLWGIEYPLAETAAPDEAALEAMLTVFASRGLVARRDG